MTEGEQLHLVIITGLSGAGRSTALRCVEDLGYFCVDNIPPLLAPQLLELVSPTARKVVSKGPSRGDAGRPPEEGTGPARLRRVGLGIDVRNGTFLQGAEDVLDRLQSDGHEVEVLFLECSDSALVRRFSETRRHHPLATGGNLFEAIQRERERLGPLRARAQQIIDTTRMNVHDLRRTIVDHIARGSGSPVMRTRVLSFGFKYGLPVDADLVFDLRFLPNPHFVDVLRPKSGLDEDVASFVFECSDSKKLLTDLENLLAPLLPRYEREGKAYLTVALGCTGGRHRSVAFAEALAQRLQANRMVRVEHRDIARGG